MVGHTLTHPGLEMSRGQAAAFLGQTSYNMGTVMVAEISDFKGCCQT